MRALAGQWILPARREASLESATRVRFLNVTRDLEECGWDSPTIPTLWRYNLHYFDDLNAKDADERIEWHRALVNRWIEENPSQSSTGWESYPVSLRVVNWTKWFLRTKHTELSWLASLAQQVHWLERRIEWHLLGNHLFANAKALIYAGLFFDDADAERWLQTGLRIATREMEEQVLADGGHFERSTMYHELFFEDMLDLINVCIVFGDSRAAEFASMARSVASRMLWWSHCMTHPDGRIAFFNDAAHGVAPDPAELERYASALGVSAPLAPQRALISLQPSGYVRMARGTGVALIDVAPVGPDYLPGHAHADTLSFELSVGQRRIIVNGGTSVYGTGSERQLERGTAAHSTVQLAGADSSEVWAGFRVGRRARPRDLTLREFSASCSHDGYAYLRGAPIVRRKWDMTDSSLAVSDEVLGGEFEGVARFHIAPGVKLESSGPGWRLLAANEHVASLRVESGTARAVHSNYAPQFGMREAIDCLLVELREGRARVLIEWA